jgi:hypothetical protein
MRIFSVDPTPVLAAAGLRSSSDRDRDRDRD